MEKFGYRLLVLIGERDFTQREFAKKIEISESSLSIYIKTNRIPKMKTLLKMAKVLNVTLDELLYGNNLEKKIDEEISNIGMYLETNIDHISTERKQQLIQILNKKGETIH